ncbi:MAG: TlpA family protein disulfide reductase [Halioglobus sp.]
MIRRIAATVLATAALLAPHSVWAEEATAAPDFTLKSRSGENIRLSEHKGDVVLVNFWASWCGPCRQEMPHLDTLNDKYTDLGFTVMGINLDAVPGEADKVLKDIPVDFTILFDPDNSASQAYGVDSMPYTVLVNRDGEVKHVHRGYRPGFEEKYEQEIRALVKE